MWSDLRFIICPFSKLLPFPDGFTFHKNNSSLLPSSSYCLSPFSSVPRSSFTVVLTHERVALHVIRDSLQVRQDLLVFLFRQGLPVVNILNSQTPWTLTQYSIVKKSNKGVGVGPCVLKGKEWESVGSLS